MAACNMTTIEARFEWDSSLSRSTWKYNRGLYLNLSEVFGQPSMPWFWLLPFHPKVQALLLERHDSTPWLNPDDTSSV